MCSHVKISEVQCNHTDIWTTLELLEVLPCGRSTKFVNPAKKTLQHAVPAPILHKTLKRHGSSTDKCCKYSYICVYRWRVEMMQFQKNTLTSQKRTHALMTVHTIYCKFLHLFRMCIKSKQHTHTKKCQITQLPSGILRYNGW